jgi:hypothetical protein
LARYRRGGEKPELPWKAGEVYTVAVHLRRGDIINDDDRHVESQNIMVKVIDTVKKAVEDAGEHHGQPIMFHVFTQVGGEPRPPLSCTAGGERRESSLRCDAPRAVV